LVVGLLFALLLCTGCGSAASMAADTKGPVMSAEEMNRPAIGPEIREISQSVKDASPDYLLLILERKTRPNILSDIDNSVKDAATRDYLKDSLVQIWSRYPVKYRPAGNRTVVTFDPEDRTVALSTEENRVLAVVNLIHARRLSAHVASDPSWARYNTPFRSFYYRTGPIGFNGIFWF